MLQFDVGEAEGDGAVRLREKGDKEVGAQRNGGGNGRLEAVRKILHS